MGCGAVGLPPAIQRALQYSSAVYGNAKIRVKLIVFCPAPLLASFAQMTYPCLVHGDDRNVSSDRHIMPPWLWLFDGVLSQDVTEDADTIHKYNTAT